MFFSLLQDDFLAALGSVSAIDDGICACSLCPCICLAGVNGNWTGGKFHISLFNWFVTLILQRIACRQDFFVI